MYCKMPHDCNIKKWMARLQHQEMDGSWQQHSCTYAEHDHHHRPLRWKTRMLHDGIVCGCHCEFLSAAATSTTRMTRERWSSTFIHKVIGRHCNDRLPLRAPLTTRCTQPALLLHKRSANLYFAGTNPTEDPVNYSDPGNHCHHSDRNFDSRLSCPRLHSHHQVQPSSTSGIRRP
jgi:hypothetical protein